jgi:O-antigen/teichoic acid export membrane protein
VAGVDALSHVTSGRLLARNSALNLIGQAAPLVVAVLAIPPLVRGLGPERFGVLSLAWATIGYFGLFEFGMGRALTQAIAKRLGRDALHELPVLARTGLLTVVLLGVVGGAILALGASPLVSLLNIPPNLRHEALVSFWLLGISLPFVLGTVGLRGIMEAHQHFAAVTALRIPLGVLSFVAPLVVLPFSTSLIPSVAALVVGRVVGFVAHSVVCLRRYDYLTVRAGSDRSTVRELLHFGGWITVSNVISPLMVYADRFVIGGLLGLAAVTAYVTPLEVVVKILIIPGAVSGALFPALSATVESQRERMRALYDRALRGNMIVTFPFVLGLVVLGELGLRLWMGNTLPPESARILQWLAVGVFITAVAQVPFTALQGASRPDLVAKLHLIEIPLYAVLLVALLKWRGLEGAAIAWTARTLVDAIALLWVARRRLDVWFEPRLGGVWAPLLMLAALGGGFARLAPSVQFVYFAVITVLFIVMSWRLLLTIPERAAIRHWVRQPWLGAYGSAALVAMLLVSLSACGPCGPTLGCDQDPRISITGQILDESSGFGIRSRVEMQPESGLQFPATAAETGGSGVFDIRSGTVGPGSAIVRLVVTPEGQRPFIVRGLPVSALARRGDAVVMPPWSRPTLPYALYFDRASNNTSIEGATIRFQQTSGPALLVDGVSVSAITDVTGPVGVTFLFRTVTLDSTGVVGGVLSVQAPGLSTPYTQTITFNAVPQFRLRHAEQRFRVPGL